MAVTLTLEQYQAFVSLARKGATTPDELRAVNHFIKDVERANGITRSALWVQWQEAGEPVPPTARFPMEWPKKYRALIERLDRPVARVDVETILEQRAIKPVTVMVTPDSGATLGWTLLDDFF